METNLDNLAAQVARHGLGYVGLLVDLEQVLGAHPHLALPALEVLLGVVATHVDRQVGTLLPAQGTLPPKPTQTSHNQYCRARTFWPQPD